MKNFLRPTKGKMILFCILCLIDFFLIRHMLGQIVGAMMWASPTTSFYVTVLRYVLLGIPLYTMSALSVVVHHELAVLVIGIFLIIVYAYVLASCILSFPEWTRVLREFYKKDSANKRLLFRIVIYPLIIIAGLWLVLDVISKLGFWGPMPYGG